MDPAMILEWIIKSVVILLVMTGGFSYVTLYERKVLARMQVASGPTRRSTRPSAAYRGWDQADSSRRAHSGEGG